MAITIGELVAKIKADTKDFRTGMGHAETQVDSFAKRASRMGALVKGAVATAFIVAGKEAVVTTNRLDSLRRGLETVSGSAAVAAAQIERLERLARLPGLGLEQVLQGSANLQAAGLSAELAEGALREFGNALAAVGRGKADLNGVIIALSQIASKGKVTAEEINQIAERVPQIRQIMQDAFGTAATEEIQAMGITSEEFIRRIVDAMESLKRATIGPQAEVENLGDAFKRLAGEVGEIVNIGARPGIRQLTSLFDSAADLLDRMTDEAETLAGTIRGMAGANFAGLTEAELRTQIDLLEERQAILKEGLQQNPFNEANLELLRRTNRELQAAQAALEGRMAPAATTGPGPLGVSPEMLATLEARARSLAEAAEEARMDLRFTKDAEAAKKLRDELARVEAELEDVNREIDRQQTGIALGGMIGGSPLTRQRAVTGTRGAGIDRSVAARARFADEVAETADNLKALNPPLEDATGFVEEFGRGLENAARSFVGGGTNIGQMIGANVASMGIGAAVDAIGKSIFGGDKDYLAALERNTRALEEIAGTRFQQLIDSVDGMSGVAAEFREAVEDFAARTGFEGRMGLIRRELEAHDREDPRLQFIALMHGLLGGNLSTGLANQVAGLNVENIDEFLQKTINQIQAGTFDPAMLGDLDLETFLDILSEMERLGDAAGEAADELASIAESLRNVPTGFKVGAFQFAATGTGSPHQATDGGGGNINIEGDLVVVTDDPEQLGDKVRRRAQRGGTDNLRFSVGSRPTGSTVRGV